MLNHYFSDCKGQTFCENLLITSGNHFWWPIITNYIKESIKDKSLDIIVLPTGAQIIVDIQASVSFPFKLQTFIDSKRIKKIFLAHHIDQFPLFEIANNKKIHEYGLLNSARQILNGTFPDIEVVCLFFKQLPNNEINIAIID